jgi:hypothetical protein
MDSVVYVVSAIISLICAVLLLRAYAANHVRLLLWSGICFVGLTLNNIFLIVDTQIFPSTDLAVIRALPAFLGMLALLYGLIWETPLA